jgi:hypothetical protein
MIEKGHAADKAEPIPDTETMFRLVQLLATRCDGLEKQVAQLRAEATTVRRSIDANEWFLRNGDAPTHNLDQWVSGISVGRTMFAQLINRPVERLIASIVVDMNEYQSIRAISVHRDRLYGWSGTAYVIITPDMMVRIYAAITQKALVAFADWDTIASVGMDRKRYTELYAKTARKLLGGTVSRDQMARRVMREVYASICETATTCKIELE